MIFLEVEQTDRFHFIFPFLKYLFVLLSSMLGILCSVCSSLAAVLGLLLTVASLVAERRLQ